MVCVSYKEYKASPILTSMDSDSYRTTDIDFPGIKINFYFKLIFDIYIYIYNFWNFKVIFPLFPLFSFYCELKKKEKRKAHASIIFRNRYLHY